MKNIALALLLGAALALPVTAQDWGSGYNMGSISALGGNASKGTINIECAESGNGIVPQGALSIFITPASSSSMRSAVPPTLNFTVGGTTLTLPIAASGSDGFVYDKTPETLPDAATLIDLLKTGSELTITAENTELARIDLKGAAAALDGVEVCLAS